MTITQQLIAKVWDVAASPGDEALEMARVCLLDWLGCTIAGAAEPVVECLAADAEPGGSYPLVGRAGKAGLRDMVLITGAAGHALDYDDGHAIYSGHPAVGVMPPLLALAAERGIGGQKLLSAIVAAYEAGARIGATLAPDHYARGFHGTSTVGAMAATLGGAWMCGLSQEEAATALGLAATRAAGLKASFGTDGKPLHAAWASLVAVTAVRWAERGMTGPTDVLGHQQGLVAFTQTYDAARAVAMADQAGIMATMFKRYAACGGTHPSINAARSLLPQCAGQEIAAIRIHISASADKMCNIANPQTGLNLKFSVRGVVGMALLGQDLSRIDSYTAETAADPSLKRLIARSEVVLEDTPIGPTKVEVDLSDGRRLTASNDGVRQESLAEKRMQVAEKFLSLTSPVLGTAAAEVLRTAVLEGDLPDVAKLIGATAPARETAAA